MNGKEIAEITPGDPVEFAIEDESNPRSVISLTSSNPTLQNAIKRLLLESPDLLELDQTEIAQKVNPTFTLSRIRLSFWHEFENANTGNRKMAMAKIIAGVCTETVFRKKVLNDNKKLAYILCPPKDYLITVKEALDAGLDNLRAIVSAKVVDDDGNLIHKSAETVLKAVALLDMRVKGAVVQRIDQRSLNVNVHKDVSPRNSSSDMPRSMEEMDQQLEQIKQKLVKDITQARLPSNPQAMNDTLSDLNVELVSVGGAYRVKDVEP